MNLLTMDEFPHSIEVDDIEYKIDTDYRNAIRIMEAWEDDRLTDQEKVFITLDRLFDEIPKNLEVAITKAMYFLNIGGETEKKQAKNKKKVYSFTKDHKQIFAAVNRVTDGKLSDNKHYHWWLFYLDFMETPENCFFSRMIQLRTQKQKGKLTKEEKQFWKENKDTLELEVVQCEVATDEEIENMKKFDEIMKKKELLRK